MTASTEHVLGSEHVAECRVLSQAANWNQNEADWRLMLSLGHGWGISDGGRLVASTLVIPYGGFAWVSMVLVRPEHRRKGYASRLLRIALDDLRSSKLMPILDATPAGRDVYRKEGFSDRWGFKRFRLPQPWRAINGRPGRAIQWRKALELDQQAFGGDREWLLRSLQSRLPRCALGMANGFVLGREGREAAQIGPLIARDESTAIALLEHALAGVDSPLYVDAVDHAPGLQQWLLEHGFEFQRPFTRMVHGDGRAPGDEKLVYLVAGPELG